MKAIHVTVPCVFEPTAELHRLMEIPRRSGELKIHCKTIEDAAAYEKSLSGMGYIRFGHPQYPTLGGPIQQVVRIGATVTILYTNEPQE